MFAGAISGPELDECLKAAAKSPDGFVAFITDRHPHLGRDLVRRVIGIVRLTYSFTYTFGELLERRIAAPVTVFTARGDDYSFIDGATGWSQRPSVTVSLDADHYGLLRDPWASRPPCCPPSAPPCARRWGCWSASPAPSW